MDPAVGVVTVRELAAELGISVKEAMALCIVSGLAVQSPERTLTPEQVARVRDVLEGRVAMSAPAPRRTVSTRAVVVGLVVVGALVILGIGASALLGYLNQEVTIAVRPGQCFNDPGAFGNEITPVPCNQDHDFRAEAVLDLNPVFGDEFPGWDAIERHARNRCAALGTGAVVNDITGTRTEFHYFGPQDARTWENPDTRKIVCAEAA